MLALLNKPSWCEVACEYRRILLFRSRALVISASQLDGSRFVLFHAPLFELGVLTLCSPSNRFHFAARLFSN